MNVGEEMYQWAQDLWPLNRSLTGEGVRKTLDYIAELVPGLQVHNVASGTKVFDWTVPDEWEIREAYIEDKDGNRIVDFADNNLHVVGYSEPVDQWVSLDELNKHLHSLPEQPTAIPYITSYYSRYWGFCIADNVRVQLPQEDYHVVIDSELKSGQLSYGELIIPGRSSKEVFLSTYVCHPSMANNELSGPVVTTALARWLISRSNNLYTYRIVYIPETIGSIVYINKNLHDLKDRVLAGFNITCVGDDNCYSYLPSRYGDTLSDNAARHVLKYIYPDYKTYTWLDRGSDERQYCAPGVDLPVATIMRSKYNEYDEYHTSLDNLDFISESGLEGAYNALSQALEIIEKNCKPQVNIICEPQLGKRGLYPAVSTIDTKDQISTMMDLISFSDGKRNLLEISNVIDKPFHEVYMNLEKLLGEGLVYLVE